MLNYKPHYAHFRYNYDYQRKDYVTVSVEFQNTNMNTNRGRVNKQQCNDNASYIKTNSMF